jgi:hypothetical protein
VLTKQGHGFDEITFLRVPPLLSLSSDLAHDHLLSLFDLTMPVHSTAKLSATAKKAMPFLDATSKGKDIRAKEVVDFLKSNYCLRYLANTDTGKEPYKGSQSPT